jgi:hypothetical protein
MSRWRVVWPLEASIGLVPASVAKAASLRQRPGWENETIAWAALMGRFRVGGQHTGGRRTSQWRTAVVAFVVAFVAIGKTQG